MGVGCYNAEFDVQSHTSIIITSLATLVGHCRKTFRCFMFLWLVTSDNHGLYNLTVTPFQVLLLLR